jgi:hypothetical protein
MCCASMLLPWLDVVAPVLYSAALCYGWFAGAHPSPMMRRCAFRLLHGVPAPSVRVHAPSACVARI